MKVSKIFLSAAAVLTWSTIAPSANAQVTTVGSQAAFSALGIVSQNTNWDSYGGGFFYPGSPFAVGSLTFIEGVQNLIGGAGTSYNLARNLFTDNAVQGTTVQIAGNFNLLGFNAGNFFGSSNTTFNILTNLGAYAFATPLVTATNLAPLTFVGFQAGAGEYFTQFSWVNSEATGITDVQLGTSSTVPEPGTYALMIVGLGMVGAASRHRRRTTLSA